MYTPIRSFSHIKISQCLGEWASDRVWIWAKGMYRVNVSYVSTLIFMPND